MRPGELKILQALMQVPNGLTYTQLKQITGLSNPVISEYLTRFVKEGMILKDLKAKLYYLAGAYLPEQALNGSERDTAVFMRNIPNEGSRIAQVIDQDQRKRIYEDFIKFHMNNISILLVMAMRNSFLEVFKDGKKRKKEQDFRKKWQRIKGKDDVKRLLDQNAGRWEAEVTRYHSLLQQKLQNWVFPYIQLLSLVYMANPKFTLSSKELPKRFSKEAVNNAFWFKQLENLDQEEAKRNPKFAELLKEKAELERKPNLA